MSFTYLFICSSEPAPREPLDPGSVTVVELSYCVHLIKEGSPIKGSSFHYLLVVGEEFGAQQI